MESDKVQFDSTKKSSQRPMWMHPIWLLVIGGPAAVVVAGITTAVIATRGQDEVLDTNASIKVLSTPSAQKAMLPAMQGRNLSTTSQVPDDQPNSPASEH